MALSTFLSTEPAEDTSLTKLDDFCIRFTKALFSEMSETVCGVQIREKCMHLVRDVENISSLTELDGCFIRFSRALFSEISEAVCGVQIRQKCMHLVRLLET